MGSKVFSLIGQQIVLANTRVTLVWIILDLLCSSELDKTRGTLVWDRTRVTVVWAE